MTAAMFRLLAVLSWIVAAPALAELTCQEPAPDSSRIAVAGGSITELIYFLGEEHRLAAVDRTSNFPHEATQLPQIGYVRSLSTEGLLSLKPTLVLGEEDMGPPEVLSQLSQTKIDWLRIPDEYTAAGIKLKLRCVATVLGIAEPQIQAAEAQLASLSEQLQLVTGADQPRTALLVLVYREGSAIVAGTNTSGDGLLKMAGIENALKDVDGWKPVSAESLIKANPDYLIFTDRAVASAGGLDKIMQRPDIRLTNAGKKQQIIQMDGMTMLGFGPRTLQAAIQLSESTALDAD